MASLSSLVSRASPFTREEGSGQLRIMSLCCRVSSGQAVQGVSSNSMLFNFAASRDAVLAGLFGARHTEYACARARLVCAMRARAQHGMTGTSGLVQNMDSGLWTGLMDWTVD